ncbi:HNH endonuclease [Sphingomonas sp. Ag1]|jgi:hypothetical protein|uniref:HNH endonuclease n=1 Tax=Sphingomonas sp. Ag1 TaxID=1642949 RepID=UPI000696C73A|nr:hypothetical protein [Sphingomonas sp. Ag1]
MTDNEDENRDRRKGVRPRRECEWDDCTNWNIGGYQAHCAKHKRITIEAGLPVQYHADKPAKKSRYHNKVTGYWLLRVPGHPLATKAGYVYEHRHVAYEKYGAGEQTCHWCDRKLAWAEVNVDHLDWDRSNNVPDNLVTACEHCNTGRFKPVEKPAQPEPKTPTQNKLMSLARSFRD